MPNDNVFVPFSVTDFSSTNYTITTTAVDWISIDFDVFPYKASTAIGRIKNTVDINVVFDPNEDSVIITGRTDMGYDTIESAFENFTKKERYETK